MSDVCLVWKIVPVAVKNNREPQIQSRACIFCSQHPHHCLQFLLGEDVLEHPIFGCVLYGTEIYFPGPAAHKPRFCFLEINRSNQIHFHFLAPALQDLCLFGHLVQLQSLVNGWWVYGGTKASAHGLQTDHVTGVFSARVWVGMGDAKGVKMGPIEAKFIASNASEYWLWNEPWTKATS